MSIIFVNKPKGITSFDLCFKLRKVLNTKAIGHIGTLDPNASGVMGILSEKDTKLNQFLVGQDKEYVCEVLLGIETDTLDICGNVINEKKCIMPSKKQIEDTLNKYIGKNKQIPPLTSAIKYKGKKLYEYQKEGIEVEIAERDVFIYEIELIEVLDETFIFRAKVSSGTYIRSLVRDVLRDLGLVGTLNNLVRTKLGFIDLKQCNSLEECLSGNFNTYDSYNILERIFESYEIDDYKKVLNGQKLFLDIDSDKVLICHKKKALAIYQRVEKNLFKCQRGLF